MSKQIIVIFLFSFLFFSCTTQQRSIKNEMVIYSKKDLKKDYENSKNFALCACLKNNGFRYYHNKKTDQSTYVYIERGLKAIAYYRDLDSITKQYIANTNYKSFKGDKVVLKMAECVDFYNSKVLKKALRVLDAKDY